MTEQQIIETLATKVMGWTKAQVDFLYPAWNPLKNSADALQIAEEAFGEEWILHKHDGGYSFKGVTPNGKVGNAYLEETKEQAICTAAEQTLQEGCNYLGKCAFCKEETELMPMEEGGICNDCVE